MAEDDSRWLRKATDVEFLFEMAHNHGVCLTHSTLDLETAKPIDEQFMMTCLEHLYWQVPVLRVCLQQRNSELWLREMKGCKIDLKVINGGDLEREKEKLNFYTYDSINGPLWCVRVVTQPNPPPSEVGGRFPFLNSLIFGIHHSVSDGSTNIKICNLLCHLIDAVMCGQVINDEPQLGEFTGDEEMKSLYKEEMVKLRENPQLCNEIKRDLAVWARVRPHIRHICAIPINELVASQTVNITFEVGETERFCKVAESHGVSLHSALTGLINSALVMILQEHGIDRGTYNIRAAHDIDVRRYYPRESSNVIGAHVPLFGYKSSFLAPKDILSAFWLSVQQFDNKFLSDVESRKVLTTAAYKFMNDKNYNFSEMFRVDTEPSYYYTISNMGDLTGSLLEEGHCLSVQRLTRFCSLRNRSSFMIVFIHIFRGKLNMNFVYSTKFLTYYFVSRLSALCQENLASLCQF